MIPLDQGARVPLTLGASTKEGSTSFAIYSGVAEGIELCLFQDHDERRIELERDELGVFSAEVAGVGHGQRYGYRVHGPFEPSRGLWCNPSKLLIDPYARALVGPVRYGPALLAYDVDDPSRASSIDSSRSVPHGVVLDRLDVAPRPGPKTPWIDSVIYEAHVKGATMRHPGVPEHLRGTYAGLAHEAFVAHLLDLGVSAIELLPVHECIDEQPLAERGLRNYWGYSTIGYLAPAARYSARARDGELGGQVAEFAEMVDRMHEAGIEVICDVVYNHSAEGDATGPSLSLRGLDSPAYYRHDDQMNLIDTTGCGNTLDAGSPVVVGLVADSLRYFAGDLGVDGFRFDLAPSLARVEGSFSRAAPILAICQSDPVLRHVKFIAEPWDVGASDSYALGWFPPPFREWNGRFRDRIRDFWRTDGGFLGEMATAFAGSADLFDAPLRAPTSSINMITTHDGFTLEDLVTYENKHNEANGEDNRDGTDDNRSWNCGVEGPCDDPGVVALRRRQASAMLATLLLSIGVPMLVAGDEMGRTQGGNNNAYCQDNQLSWLNWGVIDAERLELTKRLIALRRHHPALRRLRFFTDQRVGDLMWFTPAGDLVTEDEWNDPASRSVAICFDGRDESGHGPVDDGDLLVLINGELEPVSFILAPTLFGHFVAELASDGAQLEGAFSAGDQLSVGPRSLLVLRSAEIA